MSSYVKTIDLASNGVVDSLKTRAARLEQRIMELSLGAEGVTWPEGTAMDTARFYAKNIAGTADPEAAKAAAWEAFRVLVDETEAGQDQFWSTDLGRALFFLGVFPIGEMSRATAKAILGLKDRQRIHQLIVEGELHESMGGMISAGSVRSLMRRQ